MDLLRNDVRPGTSALLLTVADLKPHAIPEIHEAMRPFRGAVCQTTLSCDVQQFQRDIVEGPRDVATT